MGFVNCSKQGFRLLLPAAALFLSGCIYQAPITEKPTGRIDERLIGDWVSKDEQGKEERMAVVKLNDSEYIVNYGGAIFRAFESDVNGSKFVSAQNISPLKDSERLWAFVTYELQDDGKKLVLRSVNHDIISDKLKTSAEIQTAIGDNLKNPDLFNKDAGIFTKAAPE
jgi:hypothetical protein